MRNFVIVLLLLCATQVMAQKKGLDFYAWGSTGPGFASTDLKEGFTLATSLIVSPSWQAETPLGLKNRSFNVEIKMLNLLTTGTENISGRRMTDFGILLGKNFGKKVQFRLAGGIGVLRDFKRVAHYPVQQPGPPTYSDDYYSVVNMPLEAELMFASRTFGVGFCGFTNVTLGNSISGFNLRFHFGRIRD